MLIPFSPLVDNELTYKKIVFHKTPNQKKSIDLNKKQFFLFNKKKTSGYFLKLEKNNHMIPLYTMPKSIRLTLHEDKRNFSIYKKNIESLKDRMQIAFDQYKSAKTF